MKVLEGIVEDMIAHALHKAPYECVGILGVSKSGVATVRVECENHAMNPRETFYVRPEFHYKIEALLRKAGLHLGVVYHSHPSNPAVPSGADKMMMGDRQMIIISLADARPVVRVYERNSSTREVHEIPLESVSLEEIQEIESVPTV